MAPLVLIAAFAATGALAAGGAGTDDYENDVSRAAEITLQWESSDRRWRQAGNPDFDAHIKAQQEKSLELRRLTDKWTAAGRGRDFYQDTMARMRAPGAEAAAPGSGTTPADYQRDVERAGEILRAWDAKNRQWWQEGRPNPRAHGQAEQAANGEIRRLLEKWKAAGRGTEFYNDHLRAYRSGGTARPASPSGPSGGTPSQDAADDYQNDVRRAADLIRQMDAANRRWFWEKAKPEASSATPDPVAVELQRLREKWTAAGKIARFQADYIHLARGSQQTLPERLAPVIGTVILLLGFAGFLGLLYLLSRLFRREPAPPRPASTIYGSAHYAAVETDVARGACLRGVFLGKSSAPGAAAGLNGAGAPVCSTPEHHTLIVARTRTGKGTRVIVPTLLRYAGSALVIDPKGENAAITGRTRRDQLQQTIHVLNPWNVLASAYRDRGFTTATYNPLDILDRNDPNAVAIAQTLAATISPAPPGRKETYWQGNAANILAAVFLWITDQPSEKKTLARAREIITLSRKNLTKDFLIPMSASAAFDGAIREMASQFIDLAPETYSGVLSNLAETTKFLSDPQIKAATAQSSFNMEDLRGGRTTVYVVIPPERMDTQKTWLRILIAAAMHLFKNPQQEKSGPKPRCLFLIDEFPALGRLDDLPRDIATMSGFGVDFALIVQGLDQLKDHYEEAKGAILSNCAYKWFCNVSDLDSARWLSDTLGKATVETTSSSESFSASGVNKGSHSTSMSRSETGRPLLMPEEVLTLGRDVAIALQPKGHPHYLKPVDYWDLPEAFAGLKEKHGYLYWDPPLSFDENPYFAKEKEQQQQPPPPPREEPMTRKRAMEILELDGDASPEAIQKAYLRLTKMVHPDVGGGSGSNYFQKELNAARDFLLRG